MTDTTEPVAPLAGDGDPTTGGRYRRRSTEARAVQWRGDDDSYAELVAFAGRDNLRRAGLDMTGRGEVPLQLWVDANHEWLTLAVNEWVIADKAGYYPCREDVFAATYTLICEVCNDDGIVTDPEGNTVGVCGCPAGNATAPPAPPVASVANLGEHVARRRQELGVTQLDVFNRGGPSNSTLTAIERGGTNFVSPATLRKLDTGLLWPVGTAARAYAGDRDPAGPRAAVVGRPVTRDEATELPVGAAVEIDGRLIVSVDTVLGVVWNDVAQHVTYTHGLPVASALLVWLPRG